MATKANQPTSERILTSGEIKNIVAKIFAHCPATTDQADELARAILKAFDILSFEEDEVKRTILNIEFSREVYARTQDFAKQMDEFAVAAGCHFDRVAEQGA